MCVYVLHKQEEDGEHDLEVANFKLLQPRGTQKVRTGVTGNPEWMER